MNVKGIPTWVLVWVALLLLVLVIFLANRENIENVLENTGFNEALGTQVEDPVVLRPTEETELTLPNTGEAESENRDTSLEIDETLQDLIEPAEVLTEETIEQTDTSNIEENSRIEKTKLYFILIQQNGNIDVIPTIRDIPLGNTPLIQTINALIEGPSPRELSQGLLNLIPPGTRLLGAQVKDGTAFLDFSEDFMFNTLGMEGYIAQLQQVVLSATQFPGVRGVQFKIQGTFRDSLGSEGLDIARPWTLERLDEL
jgi:germination protein M